MESAIITLTTVGYINSQLTTRFELIPLIPEHSDVVREVVQVVAIQRYIDSIQSNLFMCTDLFSVGLVSGEKESA